MPGKSIKDCLEAVGIPVSALGSRMTIKEEWALIKKAYFKKVLACHPDKGGDAAVFRDVQAAFEVLRQLFDGSAFNFSFAAAQDQSTSDIYKGSKDDFKGAPMPSWEYYAEAAKEVAATYRVELARSNRSRCQSSGSRKKCELDPPFIEKGDIRIGFMLESGGYGLWTHMECWRVPSKVWLGLPDPDKCKDRKKFEGALKRMDEVSLNGVGDLKAADRTKLITHVMDKRHWSFGGDTTKVKKKPGAEAKEKTTAKGGQLASQSNSIVASKQRFVIPVPGRDGCPKGSLSGQTFVITGLFPEVGGGEGLALGKDKVKKMISAFGGKVASAVSGRTDVLVVGKDPGFSKVSKARKNPRTRLVGLHDLKVGVEKGSLESAAAKRPMLIKSFSKGFAQRRGGPNSLALKASKEELAIASGTKQRPLAIQGSAPRSKAAKAGRSRPGASPEAKKRALAIHGSAPRSKAMKAGQTSMKRKLASPETRAKLRRLFR